MVYLKRKRQHILTFLALNVIVTILSFLFYIYNYDLKNATFGDGQSKRSFTSNSSKYMIEIKASKLDRLFERLHAKEEKFGPVLDELGVFSFSRLVEKAQQQNKILEQYSDQVKKYLRVENGKVQVNKQYVSYLTNKSEHFLTTSDRINAKPKKIAKV
jgi:hypothetical protein